MKQSPKLPSRTITYIEVQYSHLDRFIKEVYGKTYEQLKEGKYIIVLKKKPLTKYAQKALNKFVETGDCSYILRILMQDMCNREMIPEGNYLIIVD